MKIFELIENGERKRFCKKISTIKNYIKVVFEVNPKDIGVLNLQHIFQKDYLLKSGSTINIKVETHEICD